MSRFDWGPEGPPPEAYSRMTDPERYSPLHSIALGLIERLAATFDVRGVEGTGIDPEIELDRSVRPAVRLEPSREDAARITLAFTAFPGVRARFGRWHLESFPSCGCDACDEPVEEAAARLEARTESVTTGRFIEEISIPVLGRATHRHEFRSSDGRSSGTARIERARADALLAGAPASRFEWQAWPRR